MTLDGDVAPSVLESDFVAFAFDFGAASAAAGSASHALSFNFCFASSNFACNSFTLSSLSLIPTDDFAFFIFPSKAASSSLACALAFAATTPGGCQARLETYLQESSSSA